MSFEIKCHANRTQDFTIALFENNGTTALVLAATDVVRVKVGQAGATPTVDIDSVAPTANGSVVTIDTLSPASVTLRLAQGDTASLSGLYDIEVNVTDDSETTPADAIKAAEYGALAVITGQSGDVGKT